MIADMTRMTLPALGSHGEMRHDWRMERSSGQTVRALVAHGRFRGGLWLALCLLAVSACTSVPFDAADRAAIRPGANPGQPAYALPVARPEPAQIYPLVSGEETLATWLDLIGQAKGRIDVMTYIMRADRSGRAVSQALLDAADRGVHVRLLIDDVFMAMKDDRVGGLTSHPNIDIRAFNPFSRHAPAVLGYVLDHTRVNRRMHNKALIVDGRTAIVGGRNVGDEYFGQDPYLHFADFDILLRGGAVGPLSAGFELYWRDRLAVPYQRLKPRLGSEGAFQAVIEAPGDLGPLPESATARLARGKAREWPGKAEFIMDLPSKLSMNPRSAPQPVAEALYASLRAAQSEVLIVTPYFVPQDQGSELLESLEERGVDVTVVTNSLATTNHSIVHGTYSRYRDRLAARGVDFYEIRADAGAILEPGASIPVDRTVMHSKLIIVDRRFVLIGSPNLDPRSLKLNTEHIYRIDSPALARHLSDQWGRIADTAAYHVDVGETGLPRWLRRKGSDRTTFLPNPDAGFFARFIAILGGILPIEEDL
ncbi:phospholipase D family protein [Defluviimonas sp. WL0002]|uniref:Phospholipase D n=1 Tax=Albidovulum marisflavi TaxID=2984159 RepID=A0ABT2ZGR5_9RHOB|nr:phospholipase D family protein [Defluviimonas sp. WL0002]MCV2870217.1 phospholipase D family protein [Defluviimonas sp. WL0002]